MGMAVRGRPPCAFLRFGDLQGKGLTGPEGPPLKECVKLEKLVLSFGSLLELNMI